MDLHRVIAFAIAGQKAKLSGPEIRFLRKYLGYSGAHFARTIGVDPATVSRWENEKEPMGATAERLLRLMIVTRQPLEEYPLDLLADVAQEDAPRPNLGIKVEGAGWHLAQAQP
jgi:DNA-binding transcriptional regulator YiaG